MALVPDIQLSTGSCAWRPYRKEPETWAGHERRAIRFVREDFGLTCSTRQMTMP